MEETVQHRDVRKFAFGDVFLVALMLLICFVTLYPVWYTVVLSFNESSDTMLGGFIGGRASSASKATGLFSWIIRSCRPSM